MKYNIIRIIYKTVFLVALMVLGSIYVKAADGPCDPFDPEPDCRDWDPDNEVPIDGGAGILLAAGVAYGLKRVYDKRKQNKGETDKV